MHTDRTLTPWLDTDLTDIEGEEWRDVIGYDGIYNVSNYGRVKSLARRDMRGKSVRARIMRQKVNRGGDVTLNLHYDKIMKTILVVTLVGDAFLPKKDIGLVYIHKNKNQLDNRLNNIFLGSLSESMKLTIAVGKMPLSSGNSHIGNFKKSQEQTYLGQYGVYEGEQLIAKICKGCGEKKALSEYHSQQGRAVHFCKKCTAERSRNQEEGGGKFTRNLKKQGLRKCSKCREVKSVSEYNVTPPGARPARTCTSCNNQKYPYYLNDVLTASAAK